MVDFETALAEIKRGAEEILIEDELTGCCFGSGFSGFQ